MKINNLQLNELVARRYELSQDEEEGYLKRPITEEEKIVYSKLLDQNRLEIFSYLRENKYKLHFEDIFYALDMCGYEPNLISSGEGTWCVNPDNDLCNDEIDWSLTIREAVYVYIDTIYNMVIEETE